MPLSVCSQSLRSPSVASLNAGNQSNGKTCGLPPSNSIKSRPSLKTTLAFLSCLRVVNNGIAVPLYPIAIGSPPVEETFYFKLFKALPTGEGWATRPCYDKPLVRRHLPLNGQSVSIHQRPALR
jgi:hypothetical protein